MKRATATAWRLTLAAFAMLALGVSGTVGEQFWYTYEGYDYPELEGPWVRYTRAGGAQRSLEDGSLVIDSMANWEIVDEYLIDTAFALEPGEHLQVDWRVRIDQCVGLLDAGVLVTAGADGIVFLMYGMDSVYFEPEGGSINFAPGLFHDYSFQSTDMETYDFYLDGQLARTGHFIGPWSRSGICWGDVTEGDSSISTFDYVRFGIVPEPASGPALALAGLAATLVRSRRPGRGYREMV